MFWSVQNIPSHAKYNVGDIRIAFADFVKAFTKVEFPCSVLLLLQTHLETWIKIVQGSLVIEWKKNYI